MGTAEIIGIAAAGGIVGLLLLRRSQTDTTTDPCAGLTGDALVACKAYGVVGDLVNTIQQNMKTDAQHFDDERARRVANNDKLNGPRDPTWEGDVTAGSFRAIAASWADVNPAPAAPYRYANGCEPYAFAPGWSKCAAGTLDQYEMAVEQAAGTNAKLYDEARAFVGTVFETPAAMAAARANNDKHHDETDSHWYQISLGAAWSPRPVEPLNKDHYGTGASGDAITQGPWVDPAGSIWWLVRGRRFKAPAGKVPLLIAMRARGPRVAGETQADVDAAIIALSDAAAVSLIGVGTYGSSSGTGTRTIYDCTKIQADAASLAKQLNGGALTWDPSTSSWRRARAGEVINTGPCGGWSSKVVAASAAHVVAGLFGVSK